VSAIRLAPQSPLLLKFAPLILKMANTGNMTIQILRSSYIDVMIQYFKNISQIGGLLLIYLTMGAIATEKERGTIAWILVKPVSKLEFVAAKFLVYWLSLLVSLIAAAIVCYLYTVILFRELPVKAFLYFNGLLLIYALTIVSLTLFYSALLKSQMAVGIASFCSWILLSVCSLNFIGDYLPTKYLQEGLWLLKGTLPWQPFLGSTILIIAFVVGTIFVFYRWEP
jgi:ABC-2 type transport system permease protein